MFFLFPWGMNEKTDVHIFVYTPAIQCAHRFFHSYRKETKKINNQFLNENMTKIFLKELKPF